MNDIGRLIMKHGMNNLNRACGIKQCSSSNSLLTRFYLIGHIIGTGSLPSGGKPTSYIS